MDWSSAAVGLAWVLLFMTGMYLVARRKQDNGLADVGWGLGFAVLALATLLGRDTVGLRQWVVTVCVWLWGGRLALYIGIRHRGRKGEDFRYASMRAKWRERGHEQLYSFLYVFMLQGLLLFGVGWPVTVTNTSDIGRMAWWNWMGLAVFAAGFLLEALADWQLLRFKRRFPHGRILTTGCWSRTRHPNYLGESVLWWGIGLMSLTGSGGVHVFLGPILITFLLVRVSGVPLLEGKYKDNPEYQAYARRSGAFLPRLRQSS